MNDIWIPKFLLSPFLTLFYMGFWRYVNTWVGIKTIPPIKIHQNDSNLEKSHVLAKIDHSCPLFMHLELNYYHFWPKKGHKNRCIFTRIEGSPFGFYVEKIVNVKFFGNFKKKSQKWHTQDLSNIERNKVMKNQPNQGIPQGLVYNNQSRGVNLTPPPL